MYKTNKQEKQVMRVRFTKKTALALLWIISYIVVPVAIAYSAAFQLFEENTASLGDYGAGEAATADDASTAWYNPAGMVELTQPEISFSGDAIFLNNKFTGTSVWRSPNPALPTAPFIYQQQGMTEANQQSLVPAFHAVYPFDSSKAALGFSIIVPFGLSTDYSDADFTRYIATNTSLQVTDFSPSVAFKMTPDFAIGGGLDVMYSTFDFASVVGLPGVPFVIPSNALDSVSDSAGNGWGLGFHTGVLWHFNDNNTRIGIAYHSESHATLQGNSTLTGPLATFATSGATSELVSHQLETGLNLPASIDISGYQQVTARWALMASVINTQWHNLQNVTLQNVAAVDGFLLPTNTDISLPFRYHNTWRFALGTNYQLTSTWLIRFGGGYDESPVPDNTRTIRLPDENRFALSVGSTYQFTPTVSMDVGWTHLFVHNAAINNTTVLGTTAVTAIGSSTMNANLVGAQLNVKFA